MALSDIGSIGQFLTNPFGLPSNAEWNLSPGKFQNKVTGAEATFFYETRKGDTPNQLTALDTLSDGGGRRLAIFEYPYRDGQRIEDLGRKGEKFTFNLKFHGTDYQLKFKEFLDVVVAAKDQGVLTHPVRGQIPCRFSDYEFIHRYDEWNSVTIRAIFVEDNQDVIENANLQGASPNSTLRNALQTINDVQATISSGISTVSAALLIPSTVKATMTNRLNSIIGQASRLMGQIAATFSTSAQLQNLTASSSNLPKGISSLNSGQVQNGLSPTQSLPVTYQVGFSPADQTLAAASINGFNASNQVTPQQAVYGTNQLRGAISTAVAELTTNLGNAGYSLVVQYKNLAVQIQAAIESALSSAQPTVKNYTVPSNMSLRQAAFLNGLAVDRGNDISALNPFLPSVNFVPRGTVIQVPVS